MVEGAGLAAKPARPSVLLRLLRWVRPEEGYLVFLLAWVGVMALPVAILLGNGFPGADPLPGLATLGLITAWWLAARGVSGWAAAVLSITAGALAVLLWGVHVLRPGPLLSQAGRWLAWWAGEGAEPAPPVTALAEQAEALAGFSQRVAWWVRGLATGQGSPDNLVVIALACILGWLVAAWAGWWLARHGHVFAALIPTGALLFVQTYRISRGYELILVFLAAATCLLVLVSLGRRMREWESGGVDYSPEMRFDAVMVTLQVTALVLVLSPLLPFLTSHQISDAFWRVFRRPYQQFEERVNRSFEPLGAARSLVPPEGVAPGGLPRAHLLGGRPELGQEVALRVRVQTAARDQPLRWRGQTFARYTGQGWEEDAQALTTADLAAGEPWAPDQGLAARPPILAFVTVASGPRSVVYAPGEPVSVDRPYRVNLRAPGELVAVQTRPPTGAYGVLGTTAVRDAAALREAGTRYPPPVAATYLQLPAGLPAELRAYAAEVAGAASTPAPYDVALAIEGALRKLPYSLDVPAPPPGREVVSWFLFDQRRGYCDYFATAMVVLARLNGIPARLAVGYAEGDYDERSGQYVVTELSAHSWPELYFPGYGWVPFEPTPSQPLPGTTAALGIRPTGPAGAETADLDTGLAALRASADARAAVERRQGWLRGLLASLNGVLFLWLAAAWWRLARPVPTPDAGLAAAAEVTELIGWGARLGRPFRSGETLREYAGALMGLAAGAAGRAHLWPSTAARAAGIVQRDLPLLTGACEVATYGPEGEAGPALPGAGLRWRPLWSAFRRVWLACHRL